jgi:hypothetical protein
MAGLVELRELHAIFTEEPLVVTMARLLLLSGSEGSSGVIEITPAGIDKSK